MHQADGQGEHPPPRVGNDEVSKEESATDVHAHTDERSRREQIYDAASGDVRDYMTSVVFVVVTPPTIIFSAMSSTSSRWADDWTR